VIQGDTRSVSGVWAGFEVVEGERNAALQQEIRIGMNARLFPGNWRPAPEEISFAREAGFAALQFPGPERGLDAERLGAPVPEVREALRDAGIEPVMEIVVRVDAAGLTASGMTPLGVLEANLLAITALGCTCVHWHLVPLEPMEDATLQRLERSLVPQGSVAVDYARAHGFRFGIEHNEPTIGLFAEPRRCAAILDAVPDLGFVWDWNHTAPEHLPGFLALAPRTTMLHIADTRLPAVNEHLPLGMGGIDLAAYSRDLLARGFSGPAILEIGGLPQSGGYGRDTDDALIDSLHRLRAAIRPDSHAASEK
jgi:L-ribulose-5-phosphate 3-epimerase